MKAVGNYSQASKWNTMASTTISGTIEQVAQPVLAQISDDPDRERRVFRKMLRFTAFLAFPALFGMSLVAEELILVTISDVWLDSVPLLKTLCIGGAFLTFYTLYQHLVIAQGRSDIYMWCNIGQIVIQLIIILLFHSQGIVSMVVAYTVFTVAWLAVWQWNVRKLIGVTFVEALSDVLPFMLAAAAVMTTTYFVTSAIADPRLLLPVRIVVAASLYFVVMKVAKVKILEECIAYFRK